jgi:hypothetical protein
MRVPGGDYLFFGLMTAVFGWLTVKYARRLHTVLRMVRHGVRTEGECVRVETEPYNRSDTEQYFFAFRTPDGRTVEFEDLASGVGVGTPVTVTYEPHDPERTATIAGPGNWAPVIQPIILVAGCGMATLGFFAGLLSGTGLL